MHRLFFKNIKIMQIYSVPQQTPQEPSVSQWTLQGQFSLMSFCSGYPESWSLKLNLLLLGLSAQTAMLWNCDLEVSPESQEIKKSPQQILQLHSLIWVKWPSFTFPKACAAYYCNIMLFWSTYSLILLLQLLCKSEITHQNKKLYPPTLTSYNNLWKFNSQ